MAPTRIVFFGSPAFAVPSLIGLAEHPELCTLTGVVTQPDKPAGRGQKLTAPPVKVTAEGRGLPVLQPRSLKTPEAQQALAAFQPELIVVAAYGKILPPALLELPRLGCINVHASLLPRHRGASAIAFSILSGDAETGVSIMRLEPTLDTGPVYRRDAIPIAPDDTCASLTVKLAELGARGLVASLPNIIAGTHPPEPQEHGAASYAPLLSKEDGRLDFTKPAVELERRVRAMSPWPRAFVITAAGRLLVHVARVADAHGEPGHVIAAGASGVVVGCGEKALALSEVQPEGKRAMPAAAWAAGRRLRPGDLL